MSDALKALGKCLAELTVLEGGPSAVIEKITPLLSKDYQNETVSSELNHLLSELFCQRGRAYAETRCFVQARADLTKSVEMSAGRCSRKMYGERLYELAVVKLHMGYLAEACHDMRTSVRLFPATFAHVYFNIGLIFRQQRYAPGAEHWFGRALKRFPHDPRLKCNLFMSRLISATESHHDFVSVFLACTLQAEDDLLVQTAKIEFLKFATVEFVARNTLRARDFLDSKCSLRDDKPLPSIVVEQSSALMATLTDGKVSNFALLGESSFDVLQDFNPDDRAMLLVVLNALLEFCRDPECLPSFKLRKKIPHELQRSEERKENGKGHPTDEKGPLVEEELLKLTNKEWALWASEDLMEHSPDNKKPSPSMHPAEDPSVASNVNSMALRPGLSPEHLSFYDRSFFVTSDTPESYEFVPSLVGIHEEEQYDEFVEHYSRAMRVKIHRSLPRRCQMANWHLLYSTKTHGTSIRTLLAKCVDVSPVLLVVTTTLGEVFGGFAGKPLNESKLYGGSGESYLWTMVAEPLEEGNVQRVSDVVTSFPWSRKNEYFVLVQHDKIAFGGGGSFGLYIDETLCRGSTNVCITYDSKPLCEGKDFDVAILDIWCFLH